MLQCVESVAQGTRQRGRLVPDVKKCSSLIYTHKFFLRKQTNKIFNRAKELYCDANIFVFDSLPSTCPKKMETEKWPKAANSPLRVFCINIGSLYFNSPAYGHILQRGPLAERQENKKKEVKEKRGAKIGINQYPHKGRKHK